MSVAVTVVYEPPATVPEGLIDRPEIDGCPGIKLDTVDQVPYCRGLRA